MPRRRSAAISRDCWRSIRASGSHTLGTPRSPSGRLRRRCTRNASRRGTLGAPSWSGASNPIWMRPSSDRASPRTEHHSIGRDRSVRLFIDRYPLHHWTDQSRKSPTQSSLRVPAILAEDGSGPPPFRDRPIEWVIDTGFTGEAIAWRHHLVHDNLDPDADRWPEPLSTRWTLGGRPEQVPIRKADLWLVSNLPDLKNAPFLLS